jgi:hypothetical protein
LHVRESLNCNWKVVIDAFQEGYHIHGVHPELISSVDLSKERCGFFGWHGAATVPFGARNSEALGAEQEIEMIRALPPANFPGIADVLPRFEDLVASRSKDGRLADGTSARALLQQATRDTLMAKGLDVSGLSDDQMSDYQFWLLFPNVFIQVRAGEATVISAEPHPDGDPERCVWQVVVLLWLPPEQRAAQRAELVEIPEGEHFTYFLALEQDWEQMQRQQRGLRNRGLQYMALTRQEARVVHFHSALDRWFEEGARGR